MAQVISLYKPIGQTPLQALNHLRKFQLRKLENKKLTYAGRLDPLAEGLLLILVNPDQVTKEKLQNLPKTYHFKLLFGVATDTYDPLGLIQPAGSIPANHQPSRLDLEGALPQFIGTKLQPYPPYCSKTVNGKPLFYYARNNLLSTITIPKKKITIKKINLISNQSISAKKLKSQILQSIKLVKGNFRQEKIIKSWQEHFKSSSLATYSIFTLSVDCTSGTYIRSLAHQIGQKINIPSIALSIKRTRVGSYTLKKAIQLT